MYEAGYRSRVNLPLQLQNRVVGMLSLGWLRPAGYRTNHLAFLGQVVNAMALAIERSRLFTETRRRAEELGALAELSSALRAAPNVAEMLPILLEKAAGVVGGNSGVIYLIDPETGELVASRCQPHPGCVAAQQMPDRRVASKVAETGNIHTVDGKSQKSWEVTDSGIGIDEADLPYLFDRFYRGRRSSELKIPGTGLGLGIVKEIVILHEGQVQVQSLPGRGTTFRITLPALALPPQIESSIAVESPEKLV